MMMMTSRQTDRPSRVSDVIPVPVRSRYIHPLVAAVAMIVVALTSGACDQLDPHHASSEYREYVVVESHLIAGRALPMLLLTRTMPIDAPYTQEEVSINNASVEVQQLDGETGEVLGRFPYRLSNPGIYHPDLFVMHQVVPGGTYRLEVVVPDYGVVTATTTVPQPVRVIDPLPETIVYQCDDPAIREDERCTPADRSLTIDPGSGTGDRQASFILATISLEPGENQLTPFYQNQLEEEDEEWQNYISNASPMINEGSFERDEQGLISLRYPWLGVVFYGENQLVVNSLDRNITDFVRSQSVQLGGSTLSPGEIPNVIQHVEGGLGVFGSISSDTTVTRFIPPSLPNQDLE